MTVDTVVIKTQATGEPEGHTEKMVALVDGASTPEVAPEITSERPSWLPEEFATAEDFAKAYAELKSGTPAKPAETTKEGEKQSLEISKEPEADPAKALEAKGLDLSEFSQEFAANGSLSDESYVKLEAAGYPRNVVDTYVAGQQALAAQFETSVVSEVGGAEKYSQIVQWAKANLEPAEIDAYNAAVSSGNLAQAKLAVAGLNAKFTQSVGKEPTLSSGRTAPATEDIFQSEAQLIKAMSDPRYRTDKAYRAQVTAKLARSPIL